MYEKDYKISVILYIFLFIFYFLFLICFQRSMFVEEKDFGREI